MSYVPLAGYNEQLIYPIVLYNRSYVTLYNTQAHLNHVAF